MNPTLPSAFPSAVPNDDDEESKTSHIPREHLKDVDISVKEGLISKVEKLYERLKQTGEHASLFQVDEMIDQMVI
jgi:hypothetical protein